MRDQDSNMIYLLQISPVLHGGSDDLNHALVYLTWREMATGFGLVLLTFLLILLTALILHQ